MPEPIKRGSITGLRGRSGDATRKPRSVPQYLAAEFLNCDKRGGSLCSKRNGAAAVTMGSIFTARLQHLSRFVPGADETAAQFVGADAAATPVVARMTGGSAWTAITMKDAVATASQDMVCVTLNAKHYMFYDSTVDRAHVLESGGTQRRTGLATPAAPTVANTGAGAYAATARTYKVQWVVQASGVDTRRSELSAAVSFTPSGSGTAARVTQPTVADEGETHWKVYGAATTGDTTYKLLSTVLIATTTYDDSTNPASYSGDAPDDSGTYTNLKSYKYAATDGNRLLGLGSWESGNRNSRVEFTALLGQSGVGNDERIPQTTTLNNYIDIDENDGDFGTGVGGPLFGSMYVFKYRSFHKLVPTGKDTQPYRRLRLASIGCIRHHTITLCEDATGQAALHWLSHRGPYRFGAGGLEYLGWDIEDLWDTANLAATTVVAHAVWHSDLHQWWLWFATGSSNDPDTLLVFDPREARFDPEVQAVRGGWYNFTGGSGLIMNARCSTMFSNTLGATMSRDLKPYIGQHGAVNRVWRCDADSTTNDASTNFQAYIETVPRPPHFDHLSHTREPRLIADAATGVTITVTARSDFGLVSDVTGTALLTASAAGETVVRKKVDGLQQADTEFLGYRIGDAAAANNGWTLHELVTREEKQEAI